MSVYPNPFSDKIYLQFDDNPSPILKISLTGMGGKKIFETEQVEISEDGSLSIKGLDLCEHGIYYLHVIHEQGVSTIKVFK